MNKGKVYRISFDDHVEDGKNPINFTVYGKLIKQTAKSITIGCWVYTSKNKLDSNTKYYTLLKSTITDSKELK